MKFLAIAAASLVFVAADKNAINAHLMAKMANSTMRTFSGNAANFISRIDSYGCWCYFNEEVGRGKGTPVDEIDGFCKSLGDGYQCASIDAAEDGLPCVPWEVPYVASFSGTISETCQMNNADQCAARACTIELAFVEKLFLYLTAGNPMPDTDTYGHKDGGKYTDFHPATGCPVRAGSQSVEKLCCGGYPNRFPFKALGGERACCGGKTYNTQLLSCCVNSEVKVSC